jgi:hypothetical protein
MQLGRGSTLIHREVTQILGARSDKRQHMGIRSMEGDIMWGSTAWMHFGAGESAARRARRDSTSGEVVSGVDRPDEWKAADGPLPSRSDSSELGERRTRQDK